MISREEFQKHLMYIITSTTMLIIHNHREDLIDQILIALKR